jgi:hypothetical protein
VEEVTIPILLDIIGIGRETGIERDIGGQTWAPCILMSFIANDLDYWIIVQVVEWNDCVVIFGSKGLTDRNDLHGLNTHVRVGTRIKDKIHAVDCDKVRNVAEDHEISETDGSGNGVIIWDELDNRRGSSLEQKLLRVEIVVVW